MMKLYEIFDMIDLKRNYEKIINCFFEHLINDDGILDVQKISVISHLAIYYPEKINDIEHRINILHLSYYNDLKMFFDILNAKSKKDFIIYKLFNNNQLLKSEIQEIVNLSILSESNHYRLTMILVLIKLKGLSDENIYDLSILMAKTGKVYDYRNNQSLNFKKVIRRYPTGAVSEKIALIMPSLLMCFSKDYNFISPFLIAKTLGFTGGTWDKLKSIKGFVFPKPGQESIKLLQEEAVCMTVTIDDYNPSDKTMYLLRSLTNTIVSLPLIISSIASKQIANPVDTLILDIRYGKFAFLKNKNTAKLFYDKIEKILTRNHTNSLPVYTSTNNLLGSSIGNLLEMIEAVTLLKNKNNYGSLTFRKKEMEQQKKMVVEMTSLLLSEQFSVDKENIKSKCEFYFNSGCVYENFICLLKSHNVPMNIISLLDSETYFDALKLNEYPVFSSDKGTIKEIDQKILGSFVNQIQSFKDSEEFLCILLLKNNNDFVEVGERIANIYSTKKININNNNLGKFIKWKEK